MNEAALAAQILRISRRAAMARRSLVDPGMKRHELKVTDLMSTALITVTVNEPVKEARAEMQVELARSSLLGLPVER